MERASTNSYDVLGHAFPFHFVLDGDMRIVSAGARLLEVAPRLELGGLVNDGLKFERPASCSTMEQIRQRGEDIFILGVSLFSGLRLRGQFYPMKSEDGDQLLFLGHPWITDLAQLAEFGLRLSDFPPHAGIADMLVLVQAKNSGLIESKRLASRLQDASRELRVRNEQLEDELKRRERLEETVLQAQKMEAIGQLAGGVAHDFNNILLAINGHVALAQRAIGSSHQAAEHLTYVLDAAKRAAELTARLLAFGRRQVMTPVPVNIAHALDEIEQILRPLLGERVRLSIEHQGGLGTVIIDPAAFQQVLLNLAINARDAFEQEGEIQIRAKTLELNEPLSLSKGMVDSGSWLVMEVEDNGCGMNRETLERIFEPFYTTKKQGEGTGLGLSTVWWIVEHCKGALEVESRVGEGSIFTVYLPRGGSDLGTTSTSESEGVPEEMATGRILLVEDDQMVREAVTEMLSVGGWMVTEASGADEAVEKTEATSQPFDLVLTDMVMPGMGGRDLAVLLRRRWPDMPIVFMTGYDPESAGGLIGKDEFVLKKPFGPDELTYMLGRVHRSK